MNTGTGAGQTDPWLSIRAEGAIDLIRDLLAQDVQVRIQVSGMSMRPFLHGDETLVLAALKLRKPSIGDLLLIVDKTGSPLVHRLVRIRTRKRGTLFPRSHAPAWERI